MVVDRLDPAHEFCNMHASECILGGIVRVMQTTGCDASPKIFESEMDQID